MALVQTEGKITPALTLAMNFSNSLPIPVVEKV